MKMELKNKTKLKMNKRAIAMGQVFIFIVAIITFAVVMIFGYKAINEFLHSGEQIAFVQFKTDLETSVKRIYTEYGSVRVEDFRPPSGSEQICFVNLDAEYNDKLCSFDRGACNIWKEARDANGYDSVDENVFIKPRREGTVPIKVYRISIVSEEEEKGFLCLPIVMGKFSLMLEGKGDRTELSKVSKQGQ